MAGAELVNDIWGCKYDEDIAKVIAENKVACCLMHNRDLEKNPYGADIINDICKDVEESVNIVKNAGVSDDKIIVDPGIGFGKSYEDNLFVMNNVERLKALGYPVLLGTSRKSMIGLTLNLPAEERLEGTIATSVLGVIKGCGIIRVHDVLENKRAVLMTKAILNAGK